MLNYRDVDIKNIVAEVLNTRELSLTPVGNHHLKRHLVYRVDMDSGIKYIFKLYYKTGRRSREISALKAIESSGIKCPKVVKWGNLESRDEWLLISYINGELLDSAIKKTSRQNTLSLYQEMGDALGKLHSYKTFHFIGDWDEEERPQDISKNYYQSFIDNQEANIKVLQGMDLPQRGLFQKAISIIRDNYNLFDIEIIPRLRHNDFDGRNILVESKGDAYEISGIIDFEQSYPGNHETDFISLYYRYFLDNNEYEKAFIKGYQNYLKIDSNFYNRLRIYLLSFAIGNCTWAYEQAPEYYKDNIAFLEKILS